MRIFRNIIEAATAPLEAQRVPDTRYIAGVNWARGNDYTTIIMLDADESRMVALERFTGVGYHRQHGRVTDLCQRWQPAVIWAGANSIGRVNTEDLMREGLPVRPFTFTARSKAPLIEGLAIAIAHREITLQAHPALINQLADYTVTPLPGGGIRYSAPPGGQDDTVTALALAYYGAQGGIRVDFA